MGSKENKKEIAIGKFEELINKRQSQGGIITADYYADMCTILTKKTMMNTMTKNIQ